MINLLVPCVNLRKEQYDGKNHRWQNDIREGKELHESIIKL
jgi:hypothetical protein